MPKGLFEYLQKLSGGNLPEKVEQSLTGSIEETFNHMPAMGRLAFEEMEDGSRTVFCQPLTAAKGSIIHTLIEDSLGKRTMTSVFVPGVDASYLEKPNGEPWEEGEDPECKLIEWI